MPVDIRPYTVRVPEGTLTDLRDRLARTRWPDEVEDVEWGYGIPLGYMNSLVEYWWGGFDWRRRRRGSMLCTTTGRRSMASGSMSSMWWAIIRPSRGSCPARTSDRARPLIDAERAYRRVRERFGDVEGGYHQTGVPFLYAPLPSLAAVTTCRPDAAALAALFADDAPVALLVFTLETVAPDATVHARMFGPHAMGIPEDAATGGAAGPLGAYLTRHGGLPAGPEARFIVEQGMEMGRPSRVHVEVSRQGEGIAGPRVGGQTVIVGEGTVFWD